MTDAAEKLADNISDITSQENGWDKVILTGHSMGGLVTKKYISVHGGNSVEMLFTMGTPYYGAVKPYKFFKEGDNFDISFLGLDILDPESVLEIVQNWPGAHQLLATKKYEKVAKESPYRLWQFDREEDGDMIDDQRVSVRDAYLNNNYTKLENENLAIKGIRFHNSLVKGFPNVEHVYIAYGSGIDTITQVNITGSKSSPEYFFEETPTGDGTFDRDSALAKKDGGPNVRRHVFFETHADLPNSDDVQKWLWQKIKALNNNP